MTMSISEPVVRQHSEAEAEASQQQSKVKMEPAQSHHAEPQQALAGARPLCGLLETQQAAPGIDNSMSAGSKSGSNSSNKKLQCPHCWVRLSNSGQFRGHLRIHTGERPFKCDHPFCYKTFTRNEELTRHKRIHTGHRPYGCSICNKCFGRKDHLKKHTKTHERQRRLAAIATSGSLQSGGNATIAMADGAPNVANSMGYRGGGGGSSNSSSSSSSSSANGSGIGSYSNSGENDCVNVEEHDELARAQLDANDNNLDDGPQPNQDPDEVQDLDQSQVLDQDPDYHRRVGALERALSEADDSSSCTQPAVNMIVHQRQQHQHQHQQHLQLQQNYHYQQLSSVTRSPAIPMTQSPTVSEHCSVPFPLAPMMQPSPAGLGPGVDHCTVAAAAAAAAAAVGATHHPLAGAFPFAFPYGLPLGGAYSFAPPNAAPHQRSSPTQPPTGAHPQSTNAEAETAAAAATATAAAAAAAAAYPMLLNDAVFAQQLAQFAAAHGLYANY